MSNGLFMADVESEHGVTSPAAPAILCPWKPATSSRVKIAS